MSVGQSKAIRARQGKMTRMIDEAKKLVDDRNRFLQLIPNDPFVVSNFVNVPAPIKEPNIVSQTVKAMVDKFRAKEINLVDCTYTQTFELAEPLEPLDERTEKILQEDLIRAMKMMEDQFKRDMLGPYACSEWEESLRAAKVEPAKAKWPGPFITTAGLT